ncbi:hypothetical protein SAMN05216233_1392 [Desulfoluna spongiiphila]|uniref:Uncharacterized protein n=1 Tax=Desulfoluna spongiiphila TaxID=419481 RepID=A0A1G5JPN0_9BACT|nr:hypothetical protein SAMN05216233_1392 [Desulfoluna spongiiphila]
MHVQRWLALVSSLFLFYILCGTLNLSIILGGFIYLSIYNSIVYILTRLAVKSVVQNLFILFFSIGHVFKTSVVMGNVEFYNAVGWNTVGSFDFSVQMMLNLFLVETVGLLGAFVVFSGYCHSARNRIIYSSSNLNRSFRVNPYILMAIWFISSVFIVYLVQKLGFGKHGLAVPAACKLPFKLGGLLLYVRNVFFVCFRIGIG